MKISQQLLCDYIPHWLKVTWLYKCPLVLFYGYKDMSWHCSSWQIHSCVLHLKNEALLKCGHSLLQIMGFDDNGPFCDRHSCAILLPMVQIVTMSQLISFWGRVGGLGPHMKKTVKVAADARCHLGDFLPPKWSSFPCSLDLSGLNDSWL